MRWLTDLINAERNADTASTPGRTQTTSGPDT